MNTLWMVLFVVSLSVISCGTPQNQRRQYAVEERWFGRVDGAAIKGQFIDIDINAHDRLYIRYNSRADTGVELERTRNNMVVWRVHVQPLGISHSAYTQDVDVLIWARLPEGELSPSAPAVHGDEQVMITSTGARTIHEVRALRTGELISRKIEDAQR
jgi:hypothetical protein